MYSIPANERLARRLIDARHNRTHKPRAKPPLIQTTAHEIREGLRTYIAFFSQSVHVDFVSEEFGDGGDIRGETSEAEVGGGSEVEDFGEVVRDGESLEAEAEVTSYCYAVFACHRYAGAAI